jgi:hypothetical protein
VVTAGQAGLKDGALVRQLGDATGDPESETDDDAVRAEEAA